MKILAVSQWWPPEPAQLVASLVEALAARGHELQVLTGFPNYPSGRLYPGYPLRFRRREQHDGVEVVRTPLFPSHDSSSVRRALNYLSFAASASSVGLASVRRPDVVYVYHPPITSCWPPRILKSLRGVPYVLHVQDLWPDAVMESGMVESNSQRSITERALTRMSNAAYLNAAHIVVITPGFRKALIERGVPDERISVIMNWSPVDDLPPPDNELRKVLGPVDRRILLFAGNLGRFQNLKMVVRQMASLPEHSRLHLTLLGDGLERAALQRLASELGVVNITFLDRCSPEQAIAYQQLADVHLVSLADHGFLSATIPSKTPTAMALGKPLLMVAHGDAAELVRLAAAGISCRPEPDSVAESLRQLDRLTDDELSAMGDNATMYYRQHLALNTAADSFSHTLSKAAAR